MNVLREEGVLVLEDAPYLYINYAEPSDRAQTFLSIDSRQTIHLFTGSKLVFLAPESDTCTVMQPSRSKVAKKYR